jgi:hypothetical protein
MAESLLVPWLYKVLMLEAIRNGLLEAALAKRFRRNKWYHSEIAELIFLHGYGRITPVPWDKRDSYQWKRLLNTRKPRLIGNYAALSSYLNLPEYRLRRVCPRIIEAGLEALEKAQKLIIQRIGSEILDNHRDTHGAWPNKDYTEVVRSRGFRYVFLVWVICSTYDL